MIAKRSVILHFNLLQYRLVASDFEEHLGHGVDEKKATDVLKFRLELYIVKRRTSCGSGKKKHVLQYKAVNHLLSKHI